MTVQVETFECQETAAEPIEAAQEAIELCEQLGLEGQLSLCQRGDKPADAKRSPYREMTAEERFVYRQLCPKVYRMKDYKAAPIPLRVLQIAAHFNSLRMPDMELYVWDKEAHEVKDPVLVAMSKFYHSIQTYTVCIILARWGEVLEPFAVLMQQATKAARAELQQKAKGLLSKVETATDAEVRQFNETVRVESAS